MTVLSAINAVCDVVSLDQFDTVVGNTDPNAQTMLEMAQEAGEELARRGDWTRMAKTATVTNNPFPLPEDFQRLAEGGAVQLQTGDFARQIANESVWRVVQSTASPVPFFYLTGGKVLFSPASSWPSAFFFYLSKNWLKDGANERAVITKDDNVMQFPDRLLTKGIIWRWRRQKGLSFDDQMTEFEADFALELAADRGEAQ